MRQIAGLMVAEVCSIYLKRQDGSLELFATEGLNPAAVHNTFMKRGEGLVGRCAELAVPINEPDAQNHPAFSYRPETGEEVYHSFLAVPILRGGDVLGVLTVQNKTHKEYSDEDVEVLQTTAMVLAEHLVSGAVPAPTPAPSSAAPSATSCAASRCPRVLRSATSCCTRPRVVVTELKAEDPEEEARRLETAVEELKTSIDEMLGAGRARRHRRAPRRAGSLPHVRARPRLAQAHEGGDQARHDGRGRRRARAERHPGTHAAPGRQPTGASACATSTSCPTACCASWPAAPGPMPPPPTCRTTPC